MTYNRKDHYFRKAKDQGFAARSIFKLEEMDKKYKIVKSGQQVLDLGAAPGSWSQYLSQKIGPQGRLLGIDLQAIDITLPNALFVKADMLTFDLKPLLLEHGFRLEFDLVVSDMVPKTTGIKLTDQARSLELCEMALKQAEYWLKPGGHFICKLFHGEGFELFRKQLKARFEKVEILRPDSTRKESEEIFLIGLKFNFDKRPETNAGSHGL